MYIFFHVALSQSLSPLYPLYIIYMYNYTFSLNSNSLNLLAHLPVTISLSLFQPSEATREIEATTAYNWCYNNWRDRAKPLWHQMCVCKALIYDLYHSDLIGIVSDKCSHTYSPHTSLSLPPPLSLSLSPCTGHFRSCV